MNSRWQTFYGNIQKWFAQRHQAQRIEASDKHELSIKILQKRYGYTKEKADSELNRHYSKVRFY